MEKKKIKKEPQKHMATPILVDEKQMAAVNAQQTEGDLVRQARGERSLRDMAEYLNETIPAGLPGTTTHGSVFFWEVGKHPVTGECLMAWMAFYEQGDARHQLALDILALRKGTFVAHWVDPRSKVDLDEQDLEKLRKQISKGKVSPRKAGKR